MRRLPPFYVPSDFAASIGVVLSVLSAAQQPRKPRILTAEQLERRAREDERAAWNRQVEERKAAKRAAKGI